MRRMFVIGVSTMLLGSMTSVAVAEEVPTDEDSVTEATLSEAQMRKARLIADYFAPDDATEEEVAAAVDSVVELRTGDPAVGWGAIYKLMLLAQAGIEVERSDTGWGFGKYFRELREADPDWLGDTPKNLGQLKKQLRAEEQELKAEQRQQRAEERAERKAERDERKAERDERKAERKANRGKHSKGDS